MKHTQLLLCGGGPLPNAELRRFLVQPHRERKPLLVAWASEFPEMAIARSARKLGLEESELFVSLRPPHNALEQKRFHHMLHDASSVFFTGGDQTRIMQGFDEGDLQNAVLEVFQSGKLVGGTSAGTAIMSSAMICSDSHNGSPRMGTGLGLVARAVVDQHFLKRRRQRRLEKAMILTSSELGLGIDEGAIVLLSQGNKATVVVGRAMLIEAHPLAPRRTIYHKGDTFYLETSEQARLYEAASISALG